MKKTLIRLGLTALMGISATSAMGVKATPHPIKAIQPDGTELTIRLAGDERFSAAYTLDGDLIIRDSEGYYCYAQIGADGYPEASTMRVKPFATPAFSSRERASIDEALMKKRNAIGTPPRYLFSGNAFPATGEPHGLVVLVEYTDKKFSMKDPKGFYDDQLNGEDYKQYGATGSARDFFIRNSNGLFKPKFDVYGPVALKHNMKYYGENYGFYDEDIRPDEIISEALSAIEDQADFTIYDNDGDGYIDNIFVIYAGYGEADTDMEDTIWPHSADLVDFEGITLPKIDGVYGNRYAMCNEIDGSYERPDGIGTFVHEFSHVLGLPDLYNTERTTYDTPGDWSTLDSGPYNDQGRTPPNYSIHERYALNWMEPEELRYTGDYTIQPIDVSNSGFIIPTEKEDEFFLLECRHNENNDAFIPGEGMLVWHIDFVQSIWDQNCVNNKSNHQYVDLVEADNKTDSRRESNADGDSFPGKENVTSFNFNTKPALKSWSGKNLGLAISNIKLNSDGSVSFHLEGATPESSVGAIGGDRRAVYSENGMIYSNNTEAVSIYDLSGRKIGEVKADNPLRPSAGGIYIAADPAGSIKLVVK